jgi:hypothetical protein
MVEIKVGKPDVAIDAPSHVKGVEEGNTPKKQSGMHDDGTVDARFSTGISPKRHDPLTEAMPNLPPG